MSERSKAAAGSRPLRFVLQLGQSSKIICLQEKIVENWGIDLEGTDRASECGKATRGAAEATGRSPE
jgi:hypothetical protein